MKKKNAPSCKRKNRRKPGSTISFRALEPRQLLAADVSFNAGVVTISGTPAMDFVSADYATDGRVRINVSAGSTHYYAAGSVDEIKFYGGDSPDEFTNNTSIDSFFNGGAGNDTFHGGSGDDVAYGVGGSDELNGNDGNDRLLGGDAQDDLNGGNGDDTIYGGNGNDTVHGGAGEDFISGDHGSDTVYGEGDDDYIRGFTGADTLHGGEGKDTIYGQADADTIFGDSGNDRLRGNNGNDTVYGGVGNDVLMGDVGLDNLYGEDGNDVMFGWTENDTMDGGSGNDSLYGHGGDDTLIGGTGDDVLRGGDNNDSLNGGSGVDFIYGENGDDQLFGDAGNDRLFGGNGNDGLHGGSNADSDILRGDAGADRFLTQTGDSVTDRSNDDVAIEFVNHNNNWTDAEIKVVDGSFVTLFQATGNNVLLTDPLAGNDLTFYKYSSLSGSTVGQNYLETTTRTSWGPEGTTVTKTYRREIRLEDWNESSASENSAFQNVVIHELGHNWDSEDELIAADSSFAGRWQEFMDFSGWRDTNPGGSRHDQSTDGRWWHLKSATFAENYGKTNPYEDLATMWELYFDAGPSSHNPVLQSKLDWLSDMFSDLA